jgi:hypothetical protein
MNRLLLLIALCFSFLSSHSQTGYLFIKKGQKKKRTYLEGQRIYLRLHNDTTYYGLITRLMNDTIFLSGRPIPRIAVKEVLTPPDKSRKFHISTENLLLATAGVALVTAGLTVSNQAEFEEALLAGAVIGYAPLAIAYLKNTVTFQRTKYRIGKKFRLQIIDFYLPRKRAF